MTDMLRGHVSCSRGCCRSKPGDVESARAISKREAEAEIASEYGALLDASRSFWRGASTRAVKEIAERLAV